MVHSQKTGRGRDLLIRMVWTL